MYGSIRRMLTLDGPKEGELNEDELRNIRLKHIFYIFIFTILYVSCFLMEHSHNKSAPISNQIRSKLFASTSEQLNRIQDQLGTPELESVISGSAVSDVLNLLQASCKSKSLIEDGMTEFFNCDIIRIDWNKTHPNPTHPELPCDYSSLEKYVEVGDNTPLGEFPPAINKYYDTNKIPMGQRSRPIFHMYHDSKLLLPLFSDSSDHRSGPIPSIHEKLNLIGKKLYKDEMENGSSGANTELFKDRKIVQSSEINDSYKRVNAIGRVISEQNSKRSGTKLVIDRNHHWDLLFKCDPEWVTVVFEVSAVQREKYPLWWKAKLQFMRTSPYLNHYLPEIEITTGMTYQKHYPISTLLPLVTILLFSWLLLPGALSSILMFPYNVYRLISKFGKFRDIIGHFIDPFGSRINTLSWFQISLENVIGIFITLGFIFSSLAIHFGSELCIETVYKKCIDPHLFWSENLHLSGAEYYGQVLFSLWIKTKFHAIAVLLLFIRLLEISLFSSNTSFLLMTFIFAFVPFMHFTAIFIVLLFAFSIIMHAMYGAIYLQFSTISISFYSLFLFAFGSPFSETEVGIHAYFEKSAYGAAVMLLLFEILFVTILLNMFTTIIMNSYAIATKNTECPMRMKKVTASLWYQAKLMFGFDEELQEELDTIERLGTLIKESEEAVVLDMALHLPPVITPTSNPIEIKAPLLKQS
ncbi:transmembrane domain-containing protein [Cryptosporidium canis]|uniref:Transmembrane domain-containing protein n=1 Tax=Cryptosporidium canis TaxID=195482 RepID=A0A9D5HYN8_9CRYT|nr:transmembrane domain-containing protein [Cryptosporidium canis]